MTRKPRRNIIKKSIRQRALTIEQYNSYMRNNTIKSSIEFAVEQAKSFNNIIVVDFMNFVRDSVLRNGLIEGNEDKLFEKFKELSSTKYREYEDLFNKQKEEEEIKIKEQISVYEKDIMNINERKGQLTTTNTVIQTTNVKELGKRQEQLETDLKNAPNENKQEIRAQLRKVVAEKRKLELSLEEKRRENELKNTKITLDEENTVQRMNELNKILVKINDEEYKYKYIRDRYFLPYIRTYQKADDYKENIFLYKFEEMIGNWFIEKCKLNPTVCFIIVSPTIRKNDIIDNVLTIASPRMKEADDLIVLEIFYRLKEMFYRLKEMGKTVKINSRDNYDWEGLRIKPAQDDFVILENSEKYGIETVNPNRLSGERFFKFNKIQQQTTLDMSVFVPTPVQGRGSRDTYNRYSQGNEGGRSERNNQRTRGTYTPYNKRSDTEVVSAKRKRTGFENIPASYYSTEQFPDTRLDESSFGDS